MWISLWIHILWNATKPLPLTLSIPVPLWLFKLVNSNSIFKSAELSLTYCKEDSISETLFLLSEGQRAHRRICLLRTEIPSCLVKDIKQHCKWSFSLSVPPSNSLYVCIWISLPFSLYPPLLNLWLCSRDPGSVMCLQRQHGRTHWFPPPLARQTRRISILRDAINLDFYFEESCERAQNSRRALSMLVSLFISLCSPSSPERRLRLRRWRSYLGRLS